MSPLRTYMEGVERDSTPTGFQEFFDVVENANRRIQEIGKLDDWPERKPLCEPKEKS